MAKSQAQILKDFGRDGWRVTATRPDTVTVLTENPANPAEKIPVEQPTGNLVWGITSPNGQYDEVVVAPSTIQSGDQWTTEPVYDPVKGPKEEIKTPTGESTEATSPQLAAQRAAEAAAAQALAEQRRAEDAQRAKNKADSGYGVTDAELARLRSDAASQNLTQQQVDLRARELEQSGTQRGRELDIAQANNQISAANQALAQKRLELDQIVRDDASKLDWAKFEYLKAKDASDAVVQQARLDLERLAQQQTAATQTAANTIAQGRLGLEEKTLEQRQAEARQTAETAAQTAATTAASSILTNERQAQQQGAQTGAGLLQQRAATAQGMLGSVLGLAGQRSPSGKYGGGMLSAPAGVGGAITGGIQGYSAELMGGQPTLDAAARMVQAAGGDTTSPASAAAIGVLSQMMDRYKQMTGAAHPIEQAHVAAVSNAPAPLPAAPQATGAALGAVAQPFGPGFQAPQATGTFGNPQVAVAQPFAQSGIPEGSNRGFVAPQAAPTVVLNVSS